MKSASDYTDRVQLFLAFSRQIQQITTDYDILDATLEHLHKEHRYLQNNIPSTANLRTPAGALTQHEEELRAPLQETFNSFLREAKLIRNYSNLYNERSKIGVSEGFAMVNQRDAEVCEHRSPLGNVPLIKFTLSGESQNGYRIHADRTCFPSRQPSTARHPDPVHALPTRLPRQQHLWHGLLQHVPRDRWPGNLHD